MSDSPPAAEPRTGNRCQPMWGSCGLIEGHEGRHDAWSGPWAAVHQTTDELRDKLIEHAPSPMVDAFRAAIEAEASRPPAAEAHTPTFESNRDEQYGMWRCSCGQTFAPDGVDTFAAHLPAAEAGAVEALLNRYESALNRIAGLNPAFGSDDFYRDQLHTAIEVAARALSRSDSTPEDR